MALTDHNKIDVVSLDKSGDAVTLSMVETRPWGERAELLPDLQAKLNTYLAYALDGELLRHYPEVKGKRIRFRLHYAHPPGPEEERFLQVVREQYLEPQGIEWEQGQLARD